MPDRAGSSLEQRIASLSSDQRALLLRQLERDPGRQTRPKPAEAGQVVAFFVGRAEGHAPDAAELRRFVSARLPSFMVPSRFLQLSTLPLLPNGKVDRRALAAHAHAQTTTSGRRPVGGPSDITQLLDMWRDMLDRPTLREDDDFFEAGGDSILAIQLIARAATVGLRVSMSEFFRGPTVRQMAAAARAHAGRDSRVATDEPAASSDRPVPLTPIQHWFLEQGFVGPDRWNQVQALEIPSDTDHLHLEAAVRAVVLQHEALRLALVRKAAGWQQHVRALHVPITVPIVRLTDSAEEECASVVEREVGKLHATMRLDSGLLLRAVRFTPWPRSNSDPRQPSESGSSPTRDRLYIVAHHLAVDVVSWRIILDDLEKGYSQLAQGAEITLEPPSTTFSRWSAALHGYAQRDPVRMEFARWSAPPYASALPLPRDVPPGGANDEASADVVVARLDPSETGRLLEHGVGGLRADVSELVLAALLRAIIGWSGRTTLLIGMEGHGRSDLWQEVDVSRTVGWFTCYFPMLFEAGASTSYLDLLRITKEQVRALPNKGAGYGLLRYLTADQDITSALATHPAAEVMFNYLGHERVSARGSMRFRTIPGTFGQGRTPEARRASVFEINARIAEDQLEIACGYSRNLHHRPTVEGLMREVVRLLAATARAESLTGAAALTPADFPDAGLDQSDLDRLLDRMP